MSNTVTPSWECSSSKCTFFDAIAFVGFSLLGWFPFLMSVCVCVSVCLSSKLKFYLLHPFTTSRMSVWVLWRNWEPKLESTREALWNWLSPWIAVSWQLQKYPQHSQVSMISDECESYKILTFILRGVALQATLVLVLTPLFSYD